MTSSCKVNHEKAAKYAIAASKGFSYYLPKSAQRHLQELLKQLPSVARSIYAEYYRDLMCAKACAPESAVAMMKFVTSSFPKIARKHNAFAREMNEEIDSNEHEGYEPVKFPVVAEPEMDEEEAATIASKNPATPTTLPFREATPQKKAKTTLNAQTNMTTSISNTAALSPAPDPELRASFLLENTNKSPAKPADLPQAEDTQRLTPESIRSAEDEQDAARDDEHLNVYSRKSSPLSDVPPPSAHLNDEIELFEEPTTRPETCKSLDLPHSNTPKTSVENEDEERSSSSDPTIPLPGNPDDDMTDVVETNITVPGTTVEGETRIEPTVASTLAPNAPLSEDMASGATEELNTTANVSRAPLGDDVHVDPSSKSDYALKSEEERWEDGMQALADFDWEQKGSRWLNGRGLVSIHYEDVGQSAGLFKGNHWDDAAVGDILPELHRDSDTVYDEQMIDVS